MSPGADGGHNTYPVIREVAPPHFLRSKFGTVASLIQSALTMTDLSLPSPDRARVQELLPTFGKAFAASDGRLLEAAAQSFRELTGESYRATSEAYLDCAKRLMIFEDPPGVVSAMRPLFERLIDTLPRTLGELEVSGGGRDVLDPFVVAFDYRLLSNSSVSEMLRDLFAHKCLMKLEDLVGHLHEEVLGRAGGKERVPEPEGVVGPNGRRNKEQWDATKNPYPGADARLAESEFYQIKNKTGSAKGSDGEKLGRQFRVLADKYPGARRYYVSLVAKTLAGHRSMGAFLRTDPDAEVLAGLAAFQQLGGHRDTPSVVLNLYLDVFETVSREKHFDFQAVLERMIAEWLRKYGESDPAHQLLRGIVVPKNPDDQSSRTYRGGVYNRGREGSSRAAEP